MAKLTKPQLRCLTLAAAGFEICHHLGVTYMQEGTLGHGGRIERLQSNTFHTLRAKGLLVAARAAAKYQAVPYTISNLGRTALAEAQAPTRCDCGLTYDAPEHDLHSEHWDHAPRPVVHTHRSRVVTTRVTLKAVNAALRAAGHKEELVRGDGYFYFAGGTAARWYTSTVVVENTLRGWTVDELLAERDRLAETAR